METPLKETETKSSTLSVSLAEEIAAHPLVASAEQPYHAENFKSFAAQIIQRRVEPLERQRDELVELLKRALPACEFSAMKWTAIGRHKDKVNLPDEIKEALARIKEGR